MPVFYLLLFIAAGVLILLLSALYKPIGKLAHRIWKDAKDNITEDDNKKEE